MRSMNKRDEKLYLITSDRLTTVLDILDEVSFHDWTDYDPVMAEIRDVKGKILSLRRYVEDKLEELIRG